MRCQYIINISSNIQGLRGLCMIGARLLLDMPIVKTSLSTGNGARESSGTLNTDQRKGNSFEPLRLA